MQPVMMKLEPNEYGRPLLYCIASITHIPIEEIILRTKGESLEERTRKLEVFLRECGWALAFFPGEDFEFCIPNNVYCILISSSREYAYSDCSVARTVLDEEQDILQFKHLFNPNPHKSALITRPLYVCMPFRTEYHDELED